MVTISMFVKINIFHNYIHLIKGVVLKEDKESLSGNILVQEKDRQRALSIDKTFSSFKYWTLDTQPSQDDKYLTTMKWINISDTV